MSISIRKQFSHLFTKSYVLCLQLDTPTESVTFAETEGHATVPPVEGTADEDNIVAGNNPTESNGVVRHPEDEAVVTDVPLGAGGDGGEDDNAMVALGAGGDGGERGGGGGDDGDHSDSVHPLTM